MASCFTDKTNSDLLANREDFFNGNISAMVTTITNPTTGEVLPQGMAYNYDQLNRLLSAKAFVNLDMQNNTWQSGSTYANRYYNAFTYDANGNILTQSRYSENGTQIEDMTYQYNRNTNGKMLQNRLYHVNDNVAANAFTDDIDDQGAFSSNNVNTANNYGYDGEGRLVRDDAEEIAQITWTVTGKVKEVIRTSGSMKKNLKFRYDAMGQRIAKEVYDANNNWEKTTYYVRDPQGNVMGIYEKKNDAQTQLLSYKIVERNIYGSSMVGLVKSEVELINANAPSGTNFKHAIGEKQFYEQNHLSNVISVVSDLKLSQDWNGDLMVDYYRAEIISVSDVFPYGSPMQERTINSTAVRHSFNGQEKDDEIYGEGNMTTAEFWQYDARLGRRWNMDPRGIAGISCYSTFRCNPLMFSDHEGDTSRIYDLDDNLLETINDPGPMRYIQADASRYWNYKHNYAAKARSEGVNFYSQVISNPDYASVFIESYVQSEQQLGRDRNGDFTTYVTVSTEPPWKESIPVDYPDPKPSNADNLSPQTPANMYIPPPKSLPGFPEAERVRPKGGRARWKLPNGETIEWDSQHGELERYGKNGKHKGAWDKDGKQKKGPVKGRKLQDPILTQPTPNARFVPFAMPRTVSPGVGGAVIGGGAAGGVGVEILPVLIGL